MNQHIIKSLAAFAALLSFAACNKEFEPATSGDITINASVGAMTKVAYEGNATSFTSGDKISVYAWMGDATAIPVKRVVDGVVNTFDGSAWTPASLMRWQNNTDAHYFLGISPVRIVSSFTADPYTLDPADYTGSDLLIATNVSGVLNVSCISLRMSASSMRRRCRTAGAMTILGSKGLFSSSDFLIFSLRLSM